MLAFSLFYFLEAGGYWAEWDTVNQDGYGAAQELGDTLSCARLRRNIGRLEFVKIRDRANALRADGVQNAENSSAIRIQCLQAIDHLKESIRIYEECRPEQAWEVVTVHREIADVHLELARVDPAESRQAISAYLEAQGRYLRRENSENPIASLNVSLSAAYRIAGDYENAEKCLPPALEYARELNDDGNPKHPRVLGYGWLRWAELCETRGAPGDFEKAIACYDHAIEAFHDYANPLSEARTLARKGRLLARASRAGEALGLMVQAKKILAGHHPGEAKVVEVWISQLSVPGSR
jgi:tetratricopeptide (TPR) repeat protein